MNAAKKSPQVLLYLALSALIIFASMPFRLLRNKRKKSIVFLHQMHGNSKALMEYLQANQPDWELYFCAFPDYLKKYRGEHNLASLNAFNLRDMVKVAQCDAIISNYQPLTMIYYVKCTNIKFFDVGHGLPILKKFNAHVLKYLNDYAETWVSSPAMKQDYENIYRIKTPLITTGYGRTDHLVNGDYRGIREKYNLPDKKIVMIAPTWQHKDPSRSIFPFNASENYFLKRLDNLGKKTDSLVVMRAHMLSNLKANLEDLQYVRLMSVQDYPDTEELLSVTDVLISDWSSIVFDFLPLKKPTIFLDVKAPFVGEDLKARASTKHRFGKLVKSYDELDQAVETYLKNPHAFTKEFADNVREAENFAYGNTLDGQATKRYYERLLKALASEN